jgi:hypothetical protein
VEGENIKNKEGKCKDLMDVNAHNTHVGLVMNFIEQFNHNGFP